PQPDHELKCIVRYSHWWPVFARNILETHHRLVDITMGEETQQSRYFQSISHRIVRLVGDAPHDKRCPWLRVKMRLHGRQFHWLPVGHVFSRNISADGLQ